MPTTPAIEFDIRPAGRRPSFHELRERLEHFPERADILEGELDWSYEERLALLGTLLELVGTRAAVRLGNRSAWEQALRADSH